MVFSHRVQDIADQLETEITEDSLVATDARYNFVLHVDGDVVSTAYTSESDGVLREFSTTLEGIIDDCDDPGPKCTLHLGQRSETRGKSFSLDSGCIHAATLFSEGA